MLLGIQLKNMTNIDVCCYSFSVSQEGVGGTSARAVEKKNIRFKTLYNISAYKIPQIVSMKR